MEDDDHRVTDVPAGRSHCDGVVKGSIAAAAYAQRTSPNKSKNRKQHNRHRAIKKMALVESAKHTDWTKQAEAYRIQTIEGRYFLLFVCAETEVVPERITVLGPAFAGSIAGENMNVAPSSLLVVAEN
jgi:hypothetical protein